MRILITLLMGTAAVAAASMAAVVALAAGSAAESGLACAPTAKDTVWTWPLSGAESGPGDGKASGLVGRSAGEPGNGSVGGQGNGLVSGSVGRSEDGLADAPVIRRPFEPPVHRWDSGHRGVDLGGDVGEPVLAAGPGIVLYDGRLVDRGVVVIGHGQLRTTYEPVGGAVAVGARVARGQPIGVLDPGHCSPGACLHWGLLSGHGHSTVYYDPLLLLGCGHVRLEPMETAGTAETAEYPGR